MTDTPHLTTRRGFIAAAGFGGTTLYGLWVGYGAAPGPLAMFGAARGDDTAQAAGHSGHAGGEPGSMTAETFEERVRDFVARFGEPDGSVRPRREGIGAAMPANDTHGAGGAVHEAMPSQAAHGGHGGQMPAEPQHATPSPHAPSPREDPPGAVDVWLQASRFFFEPRHLRLAAGQPYRFRLMATDVAHGASVQFGRGGRMIRLRPGQLVETGMRFRRPGEYLIYCTVYCGAGHDAMQARLSVTDGGAA